MAQYKIERKTLSEQVAEQLESDIIEGRYKPDEQLPSERTLMEQFGVGRPSIREALFYLQKLGLIAISSGSRARVIRPTPETIMAKISSASRQLLSQPEGQQYLQEARALFEIALVRYSATHATSENIEALRGALKANHEAVGDEARFKRSDNDFHATLAAIPENPFFSAIHDTLAEWLDDRRALALQKEGVDHAACEAHEAIVEAIAAGDPDAAERAMLNHLEYHYATYQELKKRRATK